MGVRAFRDRYEAGRVLAGELSAYSGRPGVIVLALPRGGVPVAYEVAREIGAPLDVFVVRKLGVPGFEELAMGAIATGGALVLNDEVVRALRVSEEAIELTTAAAKRELERRERLYRAARPPVKVRDRIVILLDDGLATGASMLAAVKALRAQQPARIVVAVPVATPDVCRLLQAQVDEIICAVTPAVLHCIGQWYEDFSQTSDDEVRELLAELSVGRQAAQDAP